MDDKTPGIPAQPPQGPKPAHPTEKGQPAKDFKEATGGHGGGAGGGQTLNSFLGAGGMEIMMKNLIKQSIDQIKHDTDKTLQHMKDDAKRARGENP